MTRLSDTQLVILSAAAQREDLSVLPLPDSLTLKGGALNKVMGSLKAKGLIDHQSVPCGDDPPPLRITRAGLEASGIETEDDASDGATPAKRQAKAQAPKPAKPAPTEKPTPRAGTKQARMIEMLKRPKGATVEQIAAATGWQNHTIRGAISGALKKKLGLTVEATRTREVGPNKSGAKGSSTVYRIVEGG
jgi:hypothetical protein